jgi:integrating conjugative element protein (TIGR03765 family)
LNRLSPGIFLTLVLSSVSAEPVVIYDAGHTVPTYVYKQILQGVSVPDFGQLWAADKAIEVDKSNNPGDPSNWLPVTSAKLTPGVEYSREVRFDQLVTPVCIIGSDAKSLAWIRQYQAVLKKHNVLCWLVSANTLAEVQTVITALNGISMSPADGDAIAEFFTIRHYPVLITQRLIEQ